MSVFSGFTKTMAVAVSAGLFIGLLAADSALAQARRPLLLEGTNSIYKRVLTRPDAALYSARGAAPGDQFAAFQPLYVFAQDPGWYEIGRSSSKGPIGWIKANDAIVWKQNIIASFSNSAGRNRQVIFKDKSKLEWLMDHEAVRAMQAEFLAAADTGTPPADMGIVAVEPKEFVSILDNFYIMPILDFEEQAHPLDDTPNLVMKVASIPLNKEKKKRANKDEFDVGIVFVFDTTQSMEPYISRTKDALERIVKDISGTDIGDRVNFGVVAFRDNPNAAPGLKYRTKRLIELQRRNDQSAVIATIRAATQVAVASSPGYNEDSLAGVEDAIRDTKWLQNTENPFDARIIILVTDAGPKGANDPNARSHIGPAELRSDAQDKNIAIMTLHLKTPSGGEAQHAYAARQYRKLSQYGGNNYYYPIDGGDPVSFERTINMVVTAMTNMIREERGEAPVGGPNEPGQKLRDLGRAMRLAFLGAERGTQVPNVIEGWVSEKAVSDPLKLVFKPRLLVTKNEMATMAEYLEKLVEAAERSRSQEDVDTFFAQVQDVVARMSQNPDRLVNTTSSTLGGALEYLDGLPYKSQLLYMTQESWSLSAGTRRQVIDGMREKTTQYRKWLHDPSVWTPLSKGAPKGEHVFAMPFDILP